MSENFEDLLRDHYRRAAENIRPDTELLDRYRRAGRPARALPVRASVLLAAAAVALTALVTWGLLRPGHREAPPGPPLPAGRPTSSPVTPPTVTPSPTPTGPHGSAPVRRPPARSSATPSPRPPQVTSPTTRTHAPTGRPSPSRPATPARVP
jgi:hypothetical protein